LVRHFQVLQIQRPLQNASGFSIFGPLASIAMSGEMKANPGSGRICYLLATYTPYNIIVVQNGKFNFCRVQNCGPLNFAACSAEHLEHA